MTPGLRRRLSGCIQYTAGRKPLQNAPFRRTMDDSNVT
jgi:hypothetical protein